jgi:hypothetical protein
MRISLAARFWFWIVSGALVLAFLVFVASQSICSIPDNTKETALVCDAKGTDLGLLYFTYCLVIVGWFGIRSNELTVQSLERAFLAVGPTQVRHFYKPPDECGVTKHVIRLTLHVHNTGRTGATIKKVYGEFSRVPPGDKVAYKNGSEVITDLSVAAGEKNELTPIAFEDEFIGDQFFWGYLEYFDIFKINHTSRFCAAIVPAPAPNNGKYQLAGSESWRECD